jgi:thiamine pyrophosphate-dependent acetolactate synthase large subunit-like protein
MDSVAVMKPETQFSAAIDAPDATGEPVVNAFRAAMAPRPGGCFIAFPRDVQSAAIEAGVPPSLPLLPLGSTPADMIRKDGKKLSKVASSADCSRTLAFAYGIRHVRLGVTSNSHTEGFQNSNQQL